MARRPPPQLPSTVASILLGHAGAASRAALVRAGATDVDLERWVRRGALVRVGRGRFAVPGSETGSPLTQHLTQLAAVLAAVPDAVATHRSAALLHGLPVFRMPPRPEVSRDYTRSVPAGCRLVTARLLDDEVEMLAGLPVTSPTRTGVDVALDRPTPEALVTLDAVLRRGLSTRDALVAALTVRGPVRGVRRARVTLDWADPGSESALESSSRGVLRGHGIPAPLCNATLRWRGDVARVDGLWPDMGIAGEADGKVKYTDITMARETTLWQEKLRQEWLEQLDLVVVRWTADEIRRRPGDVVARWRRAAARRAERPWQPPPDLVVEPFTSPIASSRRFWA